MTYYNDYARDLQCDTYKEDLFLKKQTAIFGSPEEQTSVLSKCKNITEEIKNILNYIICNNNFNYISIIANLYKFKDSELKTFKNNNL